MPLVLWPHGAVGAACAVARSGKDPSLSYGLDGGRQAIVAGLPFDWRGRALTPIE